MELHEEIGAVRRETVLDAPRDEVWARIASPEGLESWLADEVALDAVEPGASGTVVEDGVQRRVTIDEVEDGRRVALSWCTDGGDPSVVELTLDDVDDRATRLVVVELPLVTLRVATFATDRAASAARGPQMAALAA